MRSDIRTTWCLALATVTAALLGSAGCTDDQVPDTICVVSQNDDGTNAITCDDGTVINVTDGVPGDPGTTCTATDNGDGTVDVSCDDGSSVTVSDGQDGVGCTTQAEADGTLTIICGEDTETIEPGTDGTSCSVSANEDGSVDVSCTDGTEATVENGQPGGTCTVSETEGGVTITCDDGTTVDVNDGPDGGDCTVETDPDTGDLLVSCADGTEVVIVEGGNDATLVGNATLWGADDNSGITVTVEDTDFTATTDAAGDYTIEGVPPGNYAVTFDFEGYVSVRLAGITAVPGINHLPDVVLRPTEQLDLNGDVFAVDICVDPDTNEAMGYLWLEDYMLLNGAGNGSGQLAVAGDGNYNYERPGVNWVGLLATGKLVYYDATTKSAASLGNDVISSSVHCSPDGSQVAYLQNVDLGGLLEGDLAIWDDGRTDIEQGVANCGLGWSPTSGSVAYLTNIDFDQQGEGRGSYYGALRGDFNVYQVGADDPENVDYGVGCYDPVVAGLYDYGYGGYEPDDVWGSSPEYVWGADGATVRYATFDYLNTYDYDMRIYRLSDGNNTLLSADSGWDPGVYSPDGAWVVLYEYDYPGAPAYVYDTAAIADPFTQITDSAYQAPYFAWSEDGRYIAYTNNANVSSYFDLEVWDNDAGVQAQLGDVLATNMTNMTWTWAPDSSGVVFSALEPNLPPPPPAGDGAAQGVLAFWDVATQGINPYSFQARYNTLDAVYNEDGSKLLFLEFPGGEGYASLWEAGTGVVDGGVTEGGYYQFGGNLNAVWSPDGQSVASFETYGQEFFFPYYGELWLYSFVSGSAGNVMLTADSLSQYVPVQFAADGASLIVLGYPEVAVSEPAGFNPLNTDFNTWYLWEWSVADLESTLVSENALYASYSADGGSVFFVEADPNRSVSTPKGDIFQWPTLGDTAQRLDERADLLSNFVHNANDAVYVQRNLGYPAATRNGPYLVHLP